MHDSVAETSKWLKSVLQRYFNYRAVLGTLGSLNALGEREAPHWRRTSADRSQNPQLYRTRRRARWIDRYSARASPPLSRVSICRLASAGGAVRANERPYEFVWAYSETRIAAATE